MAPRIVSTNVRPLAAPVLNVQRMSTEDGPGLRTTVFLKGCSLRCAWCHNPESIDPKSQVVCYPSRCIGAGECVDACVDDALIRREGRVDIDRQRCTACGDCVERCPTAALEMLGARWQLDDLVTEVMKDRSYFAAYGGGVTVSGGEPGLYPSFVTRLLQRCRALGVHTAVDTCGMCSSAALRALTEASDLVLYDLKILDAERHAALTGQPNGRILANVLELATRMRAGARPTALWIRTPLIPGATLLDANLEGIGAFIARQLGDVVARWELCAFNNLPADQYERLGLAWPFVGVPLLTAEELRRATNVARASGVDPAIVVASGPTRAASAAAVGTRVTTVRAGRDVGTRGAPAPAGADAVLHAATRRAGVEVESG